MAGLYAGNPKRATAHHTTKRLLERFRALPRPIIWHGRCRWSHLAPFSPVQRHLFALLSFPVEIYTRLCPILTSRHGN
jgi:hypothetical protein